MTSGFSPLPQAPPAHDGDGLRAGSLTAARDVAARGQRSRIVPARRRHGPRIAAGAVLVVACVFGFLAAASAMTGRHAEVLVLTRAVPAGAALSAADLTTADLPPAPGVATIPASEESQLVGRVTAVPLTAGTLLTPADLGPPAYPAAGKAVVTLLLGPGAYPPDLQPGARVAVMTGHSTQDAGATAAPGTGNTDVIVGMVAGITPVASAGQAQTVVSLLVDDAAAAAVEQVDSPVLVELDPAGTDVP